MCLAARSMSPLYKVFHCVSAFISPSIFLPVIAHHPLAPLFFLHSVIILYPVATFSLNFSAWSLLTQRPGQLTSKQDPVRELQGVVLLLCPSTPLLTYIALNPLPSPLAVQWRMKPSPSPLKGRNLPWHDRN